MREALAASGVAGSGANSIGSHFDEQTTAAPKLTAYTKPWGGNYPIAGEWTFTTKDLQEAFRPDLKIVGAKDDEMIRKGCLAVAELDIQRRHGGPPERRPEGINANWYERSLEMTAKDPKVEEVVRAVLKAVGVIDG